MGFFTNSVVLFWQMCYNGVLITYINICSICFDTFLFGNHWILLGACS